MKLSTKQSGFSAVELLITLFIAAAFLISGYQLYAVVIKDGGVARQQANAGNRANYWLQYYKASAVNPCTPSTLATNSPDTVPGLTNVTVTAAITCPYSSTTSLSKIQVSLSYGTPQQTVSSSTYAKP
jgi:prepilin-type N-terminal cleavage/methylation domain-containing protein